MANKGIEVTVRMGDVEETRRLVAKWDIQGPDVEGELNRLEPVEAVEVVENVIDQMTSGFHEMVSDMLYKEFLKRYPDRKGEG